ncbi:MAG: hypothetical protein ACLGH0_14000, partial [Thermoanaerobaculia bacterium]
WINGEWLFEVVAYGLHEVIGITGFSFVRALLAAAIFLIVYLRNERDALLTAIAFFGAMQTFDFRPSSLAMLFVVLAIVCRSWIAHAVLAAFWINIHPSALLAPGIAALSWSDGLSARQGLGGLRVRRSIASAIALLVNPHGYRAITAPLELLSFVGSGEFVNAEWLPSRVTQFPLLYVCVLGGALLFIRKHDEWWRVLLFAGFAFLAIRHVRNQALFYAAFPLLVPSLPIKPVLRDVTGAVAILLTALTVDHRLGVPPERFPMVAVARLQSTGFKGNIYNPDQFGGFLIWSFYPERRVLTDGRNELYREFIPEYARARVHQRAWRALLGKYRIDLAVDEYRAPLQVIDGITRKQTLMPASLAYWPRKEWALIAFDEAGMVFARRAAFPGIEKWELQGVVPDAMRP